jgi:hypothetical protein
MRRSLSLLVVGALALAIPGVASAALLEWSGTNKLWLGGGRNWVVTTGTGLATVNGSSGLGHLTALRLGDGHLSRDYATLLTDPNLASVATLSIDGTWKAGTLKPFSTGGPLTDNQIPIEGTFKLCLLLVGCSAWLDSPLTVDGTRGVGIGGVVTKNGFGAGVRISLNGAPWTVGTAMLTGAFTTNAMVPNPNRATETRGGLTGYAHGPTSGTSTAQIGGSLQIVTASFVDTTLMKPSNHSVLWATTRYVFVPEPGLVLLLASGVAGLALLGRHRLRR